MSSDPLFARQREGATIADLSGEFHMTQDDVIGILTGRAYRRTGRLILGERVKKRQRFQNREVWAAQTTGLPTGSTLAPQETHYHA